MPQQIALFQYGQNWQVQRIVPLGGGGLEEKLNWLILLKKLSL
ncbi:MAG: hypothetical protein AAB666_00535 [Patescibacteria group bacterium]